VIREGAIKIGQILTRVVDWLMDTEHIIISWQLYNSLS